ncbi:MAG: hypothetical protein ACK5LO_10905 [Leucobacter sp.]
MFYILFPISLLVTALCLWRLMLRHRLPRVPSFAVVFGSWLTIGSFWGLMGTFTAEIKHGEVLDSVLTAILLVAFPLVLISAILLAVLYKPTDKTGRSGDQAGSG